MSNSAANHALIDKLAALPRFALISRPNLSQLVEAGESLCVHPGESILVQGEPGTSLFIVLSGRFKMTRSLLNGRSLLLALFQAGDPVGISLLGGRTSETTVTAIETSTCFELPHRRLMAVLAENPKLINDLLPALFEQVVECRNCAVEGTFFRVEPRLARLFLRLGESVGHRELDSTFIPVALSRQDLADMAGTSIETCIRIMSRWSKEGILETRKTGFLLRKRQLLTEMCDDC